MIWWLAYCSWFFCVLLLCLLLFDAWMLLRFCYALRLNVGVDFVCGFVLFCWVDVLVLVMCCDVYLVLGLSGYLLRLFVICLWLIWFSMFPMCFWVCGNCLLLSCGFECWFGLLIVFCLDFILMFCLFIMAILNSFILLCCMFVLSCRLLVGGIYCLYLFICCLIERFDVGL